MGNSCRGDQNYDDQTDYNKTTYKIDSFSQVIIKT